MHDLLQDLGRDIVYKESPKKPGKRSRLWREEDVQDTLKHVDGTYAVQGIFLDMFKIKDMHLSLEAFNKMYNLRLLKFYNSKKGDNKMYDLWLLEIYNIRDAQSVNKVHFRQVQNDAPPFDKLRSFIWFGYPFAALSSEFNLENLVELNLSCSGNLERLWGDTKHAPKLKWLDLHDCQRLIEIPDLSKSPLLEKIDLGGCSHLTKIQSLSNLKSLEVIDLRGCSHLTEIPDLSGSLLLRMIDIKDCRNLLDLPLLAPCVSCVRDLNLWGLESLRSFPSTIARHYEHRESLDLSSWTNLTTFPQELPHSIEHLTKLSELYLMRCENLESLPSSISNLISLQRLDISDCSKLEILPDNLGNLKSLKRLLMHRISISQLPSTIMHLNETWLISCCECRDLRFTDLLGLPCSLGALFLNYCNLNKIPEDIGRLSSLERLALSGNNFESLPKSMKQLYKLKILEVDNCNMLQSLTDLPWALERLSVSGCNMLQSLTELPSALKHLSVSGCKHLRSIPNASEFANLFDAEFIFTNCSELKETTVGNMLATLKKGYEEGNKIGELTFSCPGSKVPEWLTEGSSMVECCRPLLGFVVCAVIAFEKYSCTKDDLKRLWINYMDKCSSPNNIMDASERMGFGFGNETLINSDHIAFRFSKSSVPQKSGFQLWLPGEKNSNCRIISFGFIEGVYGETTIAVEEERAREDDIVQITEAAEKEVSAAGRSCSGHRGSAYSEEMVLAAVAAEEERAREEEMVQFKATSETRIPNPAAKKKGKFSNGSIIKHRMKTRNSGIIEEEASKVMEVGNVLGFNFTDIEQEMSEVITRREAEDVASMEDQEGQ
ncbi:hypothetical protein LWI29_023910 [Acer saccharum]|uniref:Uncharacterized protein n=1 Tax=Acer saccharum TaxID=4024 RepID=A0AA39RDL4_ACESA|nr:hypothetical protein LWI29_023910 [Acer saccharum]